MKGFKKGDRVHVSRHGFESGYGAKKKKPRNNWATVVADQDGLSVRVLRDGYKQPLEFHEDYWTLEPDLADLLAEVVSLFSKPHRDGFATYQFTLGRFPQGWTFKVVDSWYKWSASNLVHEFGAYKEPEDAVWAFLNYVRDSKIDVAKLME